MYKQLVKPNLAMLGHRGMCLKYVQDAFGTPWAGTTAWDGWTNRVSRKHANALPAGVYVPVWFDGYWNGERAGHVAIYKDGQVWSSPWDRQVGYNILGSIAEVERIYGMEYVGWSEDLGGKQLITGGDMIEDTQRHYDIINREWINSTGREFTWKEFRVNFVGKDKLEALLIIHSSPETAKWQKLAKLGQKADKEGWVRPTDSDKKLAQIKKIVG